MHPARSQRSSFLGPLSWCVVAVSPFNQDGNDPSASGASAVIVVDDDGPADHASLLAAVAAAPEGAIVLVRPGLYDIAPELVLGERAVAIIADSGAPPLLANGGIRVEGVAAGERVVLRGLVVAPPFTGAGNVLLAENPGTVWIEDCQIHARNETDGALIATDCDAVVVVASSLLGTLRSWPRSGSDGLLATDSRLFVHESLVLGGMGSNFRFRFGPALAAPIVPGVGGTGARQTRGFLFVAGSTVQGGTGGTAPSDPNFGCLGGAGGHGGVGIQLADGAAELVATELLGGFAGWGGPFPPCPSGKPGVPSVVVSGTLNSIAASVHRFALNPPVVRTDELATATFAGRPGERVWMLVSREPSAVFVPRLRGSLHADRPQLVVAGVVGASGQLVVQAPVALPPGVDGRVLHLQALFQDAAEGFTLSSPAVLTVLDPRF